MEAAPGGAAAAPEAGGPAIKATAGGARGAVGATELAYYLGPHDLKRLSLYSRNLVDYHLITDLLPMLSKLYFLGRMPSTRMSHLQEAILLAMGLQHRCVLFFPCVSLGRMQCGWTFPRRSLSLMPADMAEVAPQAHDDHYLLILVNGGWVSLVQMLLPFHEGAAVLLLLRLFLS